MSHFDYCDILYNDISVELLQKLQRVHNVCFRFIFITSHYDHVSQHFSELSWLRLNERRILHSLSLLYNILKHSSPSYLASRFHRLSSYHTLDTRSQQNSLLSIPQHRTSLYSDSYTISVVRCWNSLPEEIRGRRNLEAFKSMLVDHLQNENSHV